MDLIDNFAKLIQNHHRKMCNFQIAGVSLEGSPIQFRVASNRIDNSLSFPASSKIYGIRVDTVHTECVRLASGLNRKRGGSSNFIDFFSIISLTLVS